MPDPDMMIEVQLKYGTSGSEPDSSIFYIIWDSGPRERS